MRRAMGWGGGFRGAGKEREGRERESGVPKVGGGSGGGERERGTAGGKAGFLRWGEGVQGGGERERGTGEGKRDS